MYISLNTISSLFADYNPTIKSKDNFDCMVYYEFFQNELFKNCIHILNVTDDPKALAHPAVDEESYFLVLSENKTAEELAEEFNSPANILAINTTDLKFVHDSLQLYFELANAQGLFADTLLEILFYETGIQAMVDKVYPAFGNPIFVFDAGFNLIAANWEEAAKFPVNDPLLHNKGFSAQEFLLINKMGHIHERVKKSETPITIQHPELGFYQMICAIDTKKDLGHIVLNAFNHPFSANTEKMLVLLKRGISQQLKKDEFIRNNKGFAYEYFIKDLLDEKIAMHKENYDLLDYTSKEFNGTLYCLVIESARSAATINIPYICSEFERSFKNAKTIIYNGEIIVLITLPKESRMKEKDYKLASSICKKHRLYAGISNLFTNLLDIKNYYMQALRAIELGIPSHKTPGCFRYSEYYMRHLSTIFFQKESPEVFCHPQLEKLFKHDREHNSDYAYSLYMYLIHERNSVAAAETMHIHPNTLKYRLRNIFELIDVNLDDYHERNYLVTSYELTQK